MNSKDLSDTHALIVTSEIDIDCCGLTHTGKTRKTNQDQFLIADLHKQMHVQSSSAVFNQPQICGEAMGKLMLVADGIGGANAGEVASKMAIESTARFLLNSMHWLVHPTEPEIEQFVADLKAAAQFSHEVVRDDAQRDPEHRGMGSTLTVAYLLWPMLYVLHVGDSRCYVLRDGKLQRLTKDQTLAQHLFERGHLTEDEYKQSPYQHVLLSAIGIADELEAVVYRQRMVNGDRILICSDGVTAHLSDDEICEFLGEKRNSDETCQAIVSAANQRGGKDNITAVVANCIQRDVATNRER